MKKTLAVLGYIVLRLLAFAVPLYLLWAFNVPMLPAIVIAAFAGLIISLLFLRRPRNTVAGALYEARHPDHEVIGEDELTEDDALDAPELRAAQDAADNDARSAH